MSGWLSWTAAKDIPAEEVFRRLEEKYGRADPATFAETPLCR